MAPPTIPAEEPTDLAAGETAVWTRTLADYRPADGWSLVYYFRGPDAFDATGVADATNSYWTVTLAAGDTATKAAGTYRWRAYAQKGTGPTLESYEVLRGALEVEANFATAAGADLQLFAEQMVAAIEALLYGRVQPGRDMEQFGLAGRSAVKIPFEKLHTELGIWKAKLWRAQHPGQSFPSHAARFTAPANDSPADAGWPGALP